MLPVTARGRGLRYARWAKRFLTFAELPEEEAFRRSYTLYDPPQLEALLNPDLAPFVQDVIDEHREIYFDTPFDGSREPDVPCGREDVPPGPEPRLYGPGEHGGVHRGAGPVRGPDRRKGRLLAQRLGQDPSQAPEGRSERGRGSLAS